MEFHPTASIFPLMEGEEFTSLCQDIASNGLIEPIWTYQGLILDGRNRYRACQASGIEPVFRQYPGGDPLGFVISQNLHRRHLNESQRAMIAARLANMQVGDNQYGQANLPNHIPISQSGAADKMNVSPRLVRSAKTIERDAPSLITQIEAGKMTIHEAEKKIAWQKTQDYRAKLAEIGKITPDSDKWRIYQADIRTWQAPCQYDYIITDPPYPREYLPLYETLAERARIWLKPGGLLITMCGQSYLPEIHTLLSKHLTYYWLACYLTLHQPTPLKQRRINTTWKPILIYAHGDYTGKIFGDVYQSPQPAKTHHPWEQSAEGMFALVRQICLPGSHILDPFAGAGTTGIAALKNDCLFTGLDIDENCINICKARFAEWQQDKK